MNGPDEITKAFDEYVAAFRAGHGDPNPYLERFSGDDRRELEVLVDAFLETGPRAEVDLSGVPDPQIEAIAERVAERVGASSGGLSALVLGLRKQLALKSSDVVAELAAAYKATPAEREKIDAYYHDLEWGVPERDSRAVLSVAAARQAERTQPPSVSSGISCGTNASADGC